MAGLFSCFESRAIAGQAHCVGPQPHPRTTRPTHGSCRTSFSSWTTAPIFRTKSNRNRLGPSAGLLWVGTRSTQQNEPSSASLAQKRLTKTADGPDGDAPRITACRAASLSMKTMTRRSHKCWRHSSWDKTTGRISACPTSCRRVPRSCQSALPS